MGWDFYGFIGLFNLIYYDLVFLYHLRYLEISIVYALIFFIIYRIFFRLFIRAILLLTIKFIHPLGFDWLKLFLKLC